MVDRGRDDVGRRRKSLEMNQFEDRFVETAYGRIHYVDAGSGEVILLTHSGGASLHEFDENIERLARRARVIAWDVPGHGDSAPFAGHLTFHDYAKAAVGLLDALGIARAHVAGCSLGGILSVMMAAHYADRVGKAVIIDAQLRPGQWWADNWHWIEDMFSETVQPRDKVAPRFRSLTDAVYRQWNIDRSKAGVRTMIDVLWAVREYDLLADLGKAKVPMMMIAGGVGPAIDSVGEFSARVAGGRLEIMEGCGHFLMLDEPEEFERILLDFLGL